MPLAASLLASALYLLPVAVFVAGARAWRARPASLLATEIACAVAVDLLALLLLARFTLLDRAILISRASWGAAAVGVALARWRGRKSGATSPIRDLPLAALAAAAAIGFALSAWRSRPYAIWDRQWHIPLVASLRGQTAPFVNVYQPGVHLGYHLTGDVVAGALQALSWGRLHSSAALSLAHDLLFALTALSVTGLVHRPGRGGRWTLFAVIAPLAVLLAGPLTIGFWEGFSYLNYYQMSFRPHVVLAGLLMVGITGALLPALAGAMPPPPRAVAALAAMLGLLAITDEPAAAVLVAAVGGVIVWRWRSLSGRARWAAFAALLPVTVLVALLAFPSALRGGPPQPVSIVAPHAPGFLRPSRPLLGLLGPLLLLIDLAPMLGVLAALAFAARRSRPRPPGALLTFAALLVGVAGLLLTTVVVAHSDGESHRFMTLPMVVLPLLGLHAVEGADRQVRRGLAVVLGVPVICSVAWAIATGHVFESFRPRSYAAGIPGVDCRAATGARLFEPARPTYVPRATFYLWAGCHPVLAPGNTRGEGAVIDVGQPLAGPEALLVLQQRFVRPGASLAAACPARPQEDDPVCAAAVSRGRCAASGSEWRVCAPPRAARR